MKKWSVIQTIAIVVSMGVLSGCASNGAPQNNASSVSNTMVPALVARPSQESFAEIAEAVSLLVGSKMVFLAEDVFTQNHILLLENNAPVSLDKPSPGGKDMGKPTRIRLVKEGAQCTLLMGDGKRRVRLQRTQCIAKQ